MLTEDARRFVSVKYAVRRCCGEKAVNVNGYTLRGSNNYCHFYSRFPFIEI